MRSAPHALGAGLLTCAFRPTAGLLGPDGDLRSKLEARSGDRVPAPFGLRDRGVLFLLRVDGRRPGCVDFEPADQSGQRSGLGVEFFAAADRSLGVKELSKVVTELPESIVAGHFDLFGLALFRDAWPARQAGSPKSVRRIDRTGIEPINSLNWGRVYC